MPDFSKAKIYEMWYGNKFYIGSTTQGLSYRLSDHKSRSKQRKSKAYSYFKSVGWDKVQISIIEMYPCANKTELLCRENEHINNNRKDPDCLNTLRAYCTTQDKKNYIRDYMKVYRSKNSKKIPELQ